MPAGDNKSVVSNFGTPTIFSFCSEAYSPNPNDEYRGKLRLAGDTENITQDSFTQEELGFIDSIREKFFYSEKPQADATADPSVQQRPRYWNILEAIESFLVPSERCSSKEELMYRLRFLNFAIEIAMENPQHHGEITDKSAGEILTILSALSRQLTANVTNLDADPSTANLSPAALAQKGFDRLMVQCLAARNPNSFPAKMGDKIKDPGFINNEMLQKKFFEDPTWRSLLLDQCSDLLARLSDYWNLRINSETFFDGIMNNKGLTVDKIKEVLRKYDKLYQLLPTGTGTPHPDFDEQEQLQFLGLLAALEIEDTEDAEAAVNAVLASAQKPRSMVDRLAILWQASQQSLLEDTPLLYLLAKNGYLTATGDDDAIPAPLEKILAGEEGKFAAAKGFSTEQLTIVFEIYNRTQLSREKKSKIAKALIALTADPTNADLYKTAYRAAASENNKDEDTLAAIVSSFDDKLYDIVPPGDEHIVDLFGEEPLPDAPDRNTEAEKLISFFHKLSLYSARCILDRTQKIDLILEMLFPDKRNEWILKQSNTFKRALAKLCLDPTPSNRLNLKQRNEIANVLSNLYAVRENPFVYTEILSAQYENAERNNKFALQKAIALFAAQAFVSKPEHQLASDKIGALLEIKPASLLLQILNKSDSQLQENNQIIQERCRSRVTIRGVGSADEETIKRQLKKLKKENKEKLEKNVHLLLDRLMKERGWPGDLLAALGVALQQKEGVINFDIIEFCADHYFESLTDNSIPTVKAVNNCPYFTKDAQKAYDALEHTPRIEDRFNFFHNAHLNWFDSLTRIERTQALARLHKVLAALKDQINGTSTTTFKEKKEKENFYRNTLREACWIEARNWFDGKLGEFTSNFSEIAAAHDTLIDSNAIDKSINEYLRQHQQHLLKLGVVQKEVREKLRNCCRDYLFLRQTNPRELTLTLLYDEAKLSFEKWQHEATREKSGSAVEVKIKTILSTYLESLKRNTYAEWSDESFTQQRTMLTALRNTANAIAELPTEQRHEYILNSLKPLLRAMAALPATDSAAQTCREKLAVLFSSAEQLTHVTHYLDVFKPSAATDTDTLATQALLWQAGGEPKDSFLKRLGKFILSPTNWWSPIEKWRALKTPRFNAEKIEAIVKMNPTYATQALAKPYCDVLIKQPEILLHVVSIGLDNGQDVLGSIATNLELKAAVSAQLASIKTSGLYDPRRYNRFVLLHPDAAWRLQNLEVGNQGQTEDEMFADAFNALFGNDQIFIANAIQKNEKVEANLVALIEKAVYNKDLLQLVKIFDILKKIGYNAVPSLTEPLQNADGNDKRACEKMLRISHPDFYANDTLSVNTIVADNLISIFSNENEDEAAENEAVLGILRRNSPIFEDRLQSILNDLEVAQEKKHRLIFLDPDFANLNPANMALYSDAIASLARDDSFPFAKELCHPEAKDVRSRFKRWLASPGATVDAKSSALNALVRELLRDVTPNNLPTSFPESTAEIIAEFAQPDRLTPVDDQLSAHALTVLSDRNQTPENKKIALKLLQVIQSQEQSEEDKLAAGLDIITYVIEQKGAEMLFISSDEKPRFVKLLKEKFGVAEDDTSCTAETEADKSTVEKALFSAFLKTLEGKQGTLLSEVIARFYAINQSYIEFLIKALDACKHPSLPDVQNCASYQKQLSDLGKLKQKLAEAEAGAEAGPRPTALVF